MKEYDKNLIFIHRWNKHLFPSNLLLKGQGRVKQAFYIGHPTLILRTFPQEVKSLINEVECFGLTFNPNNIILT